jgi:hypothetical protein
MSSTGRATSVGNIKSAVSAGNMQHSQGDLSKKCQYIRTVEGRKGKEGRNESEGKMNEGK